ncbi:hypothetical protein Moror_14130 [Moniliophthora roreri MCA 2997]|uniref:G-protein coupled receptors family 1 profile domain-containing protein n=2 Tax=Moniliophthora roreri TaxID=221103 RepID=V2XM85_MONRO|nr:hypothetical protein Moror_14130 [Moniliophthora roreri MCA 2997]
MLPPDLDSGEAQYALHDRKISFILILISGGLSLLILTMIAGLACHPISRPLLDRVSFRIMVYAILANLVYCIGLGVVDKIPSESLCWILLWLLNLSLLMSSFLFFCIGLNLMLVMVHGVRGQKMEKYYVGGSILLAIIVTTPAFVTKQYGISHRRCNNLNRTVSGRLRWQITTSHLWNIMTIIGEMVTFLSILMHMVKLKVFDGTERTSPSSYESFSSVVATYRRPMGPTQYRNIVLRIGMYPLISLVTLSVATVGSIYMSVLCDKHMSTKVYAMYIMSRTAYRIRPLAYAIGAVTDPSLHRALKALYRHSPARQDSQICPEARNRLDCDIILPPISKPERAFPNTRSRFSGIPATEEHESESGMIRPWPSSQGSQEALDSALFKEI